MASAARSPHVAGVPRLVPRHRLVALLALLLSFGSVEPRTAAGAPVREGLGFGLGAGLGTGSGLGFGPAASLRATYTFNRWVGFGVEASVLDITGGNYRSSVVAAALSLYPFGGPFLLRLGAGPGRHESHTYGVYSGLGATLGAGLEFGFRSRFSIGPQLDLLAAPADPIAGSINATVQLNWYPGGKP